MLKIKIVASIAKRIQFLVRTLKYVASENSEKMANRKNDRVFKCLFQLLIKKNTGSTPECGGAFFIINIEIIKKTTVDAMMNILFWSRLYE